jgi:NADH-quinone oxidoreductase subunit H
VYGIFLGGWASNNKYSMLGALRSSAQVVSYEIPLGLSVLGVIVLSNSLNIEQVVAEQASHGWWAWNVWCQPLAGLIFFLSALAESNRLPFDLPECEQELIGGYHTEYSALKFALFFISEYTHVITISFLVALLYCGGWHFPWIAEPGSAYTGAVVVKVLVLLAKVFLSILFIMVIRWTIPRYRYDQLMGLVWKGLFPLALLNLVCVMVVKEYGLHRAWLTGASVALFLGAVAISAAAVPRQARRARRAVAEVRARWEAAERE